MKRGGKTRLKPLEKAHSRCRKLLIHWRLEARTDKMRAARKARWIPPRNGKTGTLSGETI
ncbi:hypothetical protein MyNCGM683_25670 [Achromobacter xylosoxidans]